MKRKKRMIGYFLLGLLAVLVVGVLVILPPSTGKIPKGDNMIAEKTFIDIDGSKIGTIILAKDETKPVLLVCGGGPGIPQYLLEEMYPSKLTEKFVVCYFDYRGTGLSFDADIDPETITKERYMADVVAITDYLCQRFSQEKIYIMGHSFGTYIALNTVKEHPEKYCCYIAMSQCCDQKRSETIAFDYMKQQYKEQGNTKMTKRFEGFDLEKQEDYDRYFYSGLRDEAMHDLGVGTTRDMKSVISGIFFPSLRCKAYTPLERINIWRGKAASRDFALDSINFNAFEEVPSIDVPIIFIIGKYDYTCCAELQMKYYELVEAPSKKLYEFEESAHSPLYEEPDRIMDIDFEL